MNEMNALHAIKTDQTLQMVPEIAEISPSSARKDSPSHVLKDSLSHARKDSPSHVLKDRVVTEIVGKTVATDVNGNGKLAAAIALSNPVQDSQVFLIQMLQNFKTWRKILMHP